MCRNCDELRRENARLRCRIDDLERMLAEPSEDDGAGDAFDADAGLMQRYRAYQEDASRGGGYGADVARHAAPEATGGPVDVGLAAVTRFRRHAR